MLRQRKLEEQAVINLSENLYKAVLDQLTPIAYVKSLIETFCLFFSPALIDDRLEYKLHFQLINRTLIVLTDKRDKVYEVFPPYIVSEQLLKVLGFL